MDELEMLRDTIDGADNLILRHIATRIHVAVQIREWKKDHNKPHPDPDREAEILADIGRQAKLLGLEVDYTMEVFRAIMTLTKHEQEKHMKGGEQ